MHEVDSQYNTPFVRRLDRWIGFLMLLIGVSTPAIKWIPIVSVGGLTIELANLGVLCILALFIVLAVRNPRNLTIPAALGACLISTLLLATFFFLRGETYGLMLALNSSLCLIAACGVANIRSKEVLYSTSVVVISLTLLLSLLWISAVYANIDGPGALKDYALNRERGKFIAHALKPTLNAFSPAASASDNVYVGSIINSVSTGFSVLFLLAGAISFNRSRLLLACAMIALGFSVIMFSSSAALISLFGVVVFLVKFMYLRRGNLTKVLAIAFAIPVFMVAAQPLYNFTERNVAEDKDSRSHRLQQYAEALSIGGDGLLLGDEMVTVNGHLLHNFPLFCLTSGGIVCFFFCLLSYLLAFGLMLNGAWLLSKSSTIDPRHLLMVVMPFVYLLQTMVAGGGGLPLGAAPFALGIACCAQQQVNSGDD